MTSGPLQKGRAPGEPRAETCQQNVVAGLDPAVADGFLERQGYGRARRIAVFVDVDRDPLDRQAAAPRGGVDDAEVGLVGEPEVHLVQPNDARLAVLGCLPDVYVDREL